MKASFDWNQIPIWYSGDTRIAVSRGSAGRLPAGRRDAAGGAERTATIAACRRRMLRAFDTRSQRDIADARFTYAPRRSLDLKVVIHQQARAGRAAVGRVLRLQQRQRGAADVDQRTNELNADRWSGRTRAAMARVGYDGSWFNNARRDAGLGQPAALQRPTLNDRGRLVAGPHGALAGQHGAHRQRRRVGGAAGRSRGVRLRLGRELAAGRAAPAAHDQHGDHADSAAARQRRGRGAHHLDELPLHVAADCQPLWLNGAVSASTTTTTARRTFAVDQYVRLDGTAATSLTGGSEPFDYTRHFVDLDASVTPFVVCRAPRRLRPRARRPHVSVFEETTEDTRAAVD